MSTPDTKNTDTQTSNQEIDYEKRFKDTQSYATKQAQKASELLKTNAELQAELELFKAQAKPTVQLSEEEQSALDDLKFSDPDAWRAQVNKLEIDAAEKQNSTINEVKSAAAIQVEIKERANILDEFQREHQDVEFTDELLQFDIPRRITDKLEHGQVTYKEFLHEVYNFVKSPKIIGTSNTTLDQPDLSKAGGDATPTKGIVNIEKSYENMEF